MRSEPPRTRRYGVVLIFLLIGTLAGAWHSRAVDRGRQDPLAGAVRGTIAPPAGALARFSRWTSEQTGWLFHGRAVAEENRRLQAQLAQMQGENAQLREAQIENTRLRQDLKFVQTQPGDRLAAEVIARRADPKFDVALISRGSRDGVKPRSRVVTRNGLVGIVSEVTPGTASVVLLTDENAPASGRVQRAESRAMGVCKGDYSPFLTMLYLNAGDDIKPGDLIVTSGLGGWYEKGIPIGTVTEVRKDAGGVGKTARIRPAVDFDRLEEVYVLP